MKCVLPENNTGKMGTFETRFTIPDLSADASGLKISTVIWSNQRERVKAALGAAEKVSRKELRANPRVVGGQKAIPNVSRIFRRSQSLYVNFDVYDPCPTRPMPKPAASRSEPFNKNAVKAFEIGPIDATQLAGTRPKPSRSRSRFRSKT